MPFLDWLIATDAPRVEVKVPRQRRQREKSRDKRKKRTEVFDRARRSRNPRRR